MSDDMLDLPKIMDDAERYRWLKANQAIAFTNKWGYTVCELHMQWIGSEQDLDTVIDSARKHEQT